MTKDEKSLLLYLETRAVDHSGRVDTRHMNTDDMTTAERWNKEGFVKFGRIAFKDINKHGTHWCWLSDLAWEAAGRERRERSKRLWSSRKWITAEEKRLC